MHGDPCFEAHNELSVQKFQDRIGIYHQVDTFKDIRIDSQIDSEIIGALRIDFQIELQCDSQFDSRLDHSKRLDCYWS